MNSIAQSSKYK